MFEAIRNIKTMDDIRVEKARLRYEALIAEKNLDESLGGLEKLSDIMGNVKRGYAAAQQAYQMFARISSWFNRMFSGFKKKASTDRREYAPTEEETVTF